MYTGDYHKCCHALIAGAAGLEIWQRIHFSAQCMLRGLLPRSMLLIRLCKLSLPALKILKVIEDTQVDLPHRQSL